MIEIKGLKYPLDRKYYTKDGAHLWLKHEKNYIKIGMDAFSAEFMRIINYIIIDKKQVKSGEEIGTFESSKYISKLYSPVTGEIIEVNDNIIKNPSNINKTPYKSWIIKIKPDDKEADSKFIIGGKEKILNWITEDLMKIEKK